jgi:hypothetical protein
MAVETAADRLAFLNSDEFGVDASYTPLAGGGPTAIKAIFDAAAQALEIGLEVAIQSTAPQVWVRTSDLASGGRQGDTFVIDGTTYKAVDVQPDGTGMTRVMLEKQP